MEQGNKRLIICCDGTWNEPDERVDDNPADETEPTNVLKVVRGINPVDSKGVPQVVYYDTGVGTQGLVDKYIGGGLGRGISENIQQAYRFIANNYHDGDEIVPVWLQPWCLHGALIGRLHRRCRPPGKGRICGVFPRLMRSIGYHQRNAEIPFLTKRLKQLDSPPRCPIPIKFIGVWDTVGALGAPTPILGRYTRGKVCFHDTQLGKDVQHAYHALAVDERRRPFQPDLWRGMPAEGQTIEQVWFSGVHSNVGGSYRNTVLSNITLNWLTDCAANHDLEFTKEITAVAPKPAESGRLENSFSFGYKALRSLGVSPYAREIGPQQCGDIRGQDWIVPGESVHPSAKAAIGKPIRWQW